MSCNHSLMGPNFSSFASALLLFSLWHCFYSRCCHIIHVGHKFFINNKKASTHTQTAALAIFSRKTANYIKVEASNSRESYGIAFLPYRGREFLMSAAGGACNFYFSSSRKCATRYNNMPSRRRPRSRFQTV